MDKGQLEQRMMQARDAEELLSIRQEVHSWLTSISPKEEQWHLTVSWLHDCLLRSMLQLSEAAIWQERGIVPPLAYELVLLGSGGRREQTLWSDQDHGLIYENPPANLLEQTSTYFEVLAEQLQIFMLAVGYPPCDGLVSSLNPQWRQSASDWQRMLDQWWERGDWASCRYLLIVSDARVAYGSGQLMQALKQQLYEQVRDRPAYAERLLANTLHHKVLIGILGQWLTENYGAHHGGLDLKYGAYIPMVNAVRLLALHAGLWEAAGTLDRLEQLQSQNRIPADLCERWKASFSLFLHLRSTAEHRYVSGVYEVDRHIYIRRYPKPEQDQVRRALREARTLQKWVARQLKRTEPHPDNGSGEDSHE